MDKSKTAQAEKLQSKLDKLLQTKEKRQQAFEKAKQDLSAVSKEVDSVKLKLFEILQSGFDDTAFSKWAKGKIDRNANSAKPEKQTAQNPQASTAQNQKY